MDHVGLVAVLLNWAGLLFLIRKWPGDASMTFSQHAGRHRSSAIYYAALWSICLPPFYWWLVGPLTDRLNLSWPFVAMATVATAGMTIAALVPEIGRQPYTRIHRIAAFTMVYLFIPMVAYVGWTAPLSTSASYVVWAGFAYMLYWLLLSARTGRQHKKMLHIQASYILAFELGVLAAYYL